MNQPERKAQVNSAELKDRWGLLKIGQIATCLLTRQEDSRLKAASTVSASTAYL